MANKRKSNVRQDGRSLYNSERHLRLPHGVITNENFLRLGGNSLKVLIEICSRCYGTNNGKIAASYSDLANKLKIGRQSITNALDELQLAGFIVLHKKGIFTGRKASLWEVTFLPVSGRPPSNIWAQRKIIRTCRRKAPKPKEDILRDTAKDVSIIRFLSHTSNPDADIN